MSGKGNAIIVIIIILVIAGIIGSCSDSEYERAGKEFGTWVNEGPENWTDTEKEYFNDFMEWADKN